MALILKDRVQEISTTTGTGTLTLAGAVTQFQTFSSAIGNGNTTYYTIYNAGGSQWEVGLGTVGAGTLARTTVYASSNAGALVDFTGTLYVFCDYPAGKAVYADAAGAIRVDGNPYIDFEDGNGTTVAAGRMWYSNTNGSWNLGMGGGNITQQVGEEIFIYGKASAAITEGQLIVKTGVVGASGVITFGPSPTGLTDNDGIIGIATENIALNGFGRITTFGVIHGINTSGSSVGETWADGDTLWYNPSYAGGMTKVKPTAPNIKFQVAVVINAGNGGSGSLQVLLQPGSQLGGTDSNVQLGTPTGGQLLTYDQTASYWKNTNLAAGTGISVSNATNGVITISNTNTASGTVTSVDATVPSIFSVSGVPITGSGTIAMTYSGTALPIANGGTALTSVGSSGQILTSTGTGLTYSNRTQYLGVLLSGGTTTQVPTSNGYIGILLSGGSTTQVPIS